MPGIFTKKTYIYYYTKYGEQYFRACWQSDFKSNAIYHAMVCTSNTYRSKFTQTCKHLPTQCSLSTMTKWKRVTYKIIYYVKHWDMCTHVAINNKHIVAKQQILCHHDLEMIVHNIMWPAEWQPDYIQLLNLIL